MRFCTSNYLVLLTSLFLIISASCSKSDSSDPSTVKDADGNVYHTVKIGLQTWMVENLKTTKYNDGTRIPKITDGPITATLQSPVYCWYNNDSITNKPGYGALYNWHVVSTGKLCPQGYHVPSQAEWLTLVNYLGGIGVAGGKLKEMGLAHWNTPNTSADNSSTFTALPGGSSLNGGFFGLGNTGSWWTTTSYTSDISHAMFMYFDKAEIADLNQFNEVWLSVRCIKD